MIEWASVRAFMPLRKMAAPLKEIIKGPFSSPKTVEDVPNLSKENILKLTVQNTNGRSKIFGSGKLEEKLKFRYSIRAAAEP